MSTSPTDDSIAAARRALADLGVVETQADELLSEDINEVLSRYGIRDEQVISRLHLQTPVLGALGALPGTRRSVNRLYALVRHPNTPSEFLSTVTSVLTTASATGSTVSGWPALDKTNPMMSNYGDLPAHLAAHRNLPTQDRITLLRNVPATAHGVHSSGVYKGDTDVTRAMLNAAIRDTIICEEEYVGEGRINMIGQFRFNSIAMIINPVMSRVETTDAYREQAARERERLAAEFPTEIAHLGVTILNATHHEDYHHLVMRALANPNGPLWSQLSDEDHSRILIRLAITA